MLYAKIIKDVVEKYPYSVASMKADNPNVSFPSELSPERLTQYDCYEVIAASEPAADWYQGIREATPVKQNNEWHQVWETYNLTAEEQAEKIDQQWEEIRKERDRRLYLSDFTQLADTSVTNTEEWKNYRQALRDMPEHTADPFNPTWPTVPQAVK